MSFATDLFAQDSYHFHGEMHTDFKALLKDHGYRYVFYLRQCQAGGWRKILFSIPRKHLSLRHGLEISPDVRCGGGVVPWAPLQHYCQQRGGSWHER